MRAAAMKYAAADAPASPVGSRVEGLDWTRIAAELDAFGSATTGPLLTREECAGLTAGYDDDAGFRSRVVMARHGFGRGEYKYYAYPLPAPIAALRRALYPSLAAIANRWHEALGRPGGYPTKHEPYLERCHAAGQTRPTPLLLRYREGDYNCLHQDLYGALAFPLQAAFLLSRPAEDFTGGEFVLTEQRPRMQSRAEVVPLRQGEGVIFPVDQRPVRGGRGVYRVAMRHGVSRLRSGERFTLGVIFHDAA
ncbi:MAG: 2OG-Fe(II) oxygenase [Hyphomicrobiales bacterium]